MFFSRSALLTGAFLIFPVLGFSATFIVSNTNDSGAGSFRQALLDAAANAGPDNVNFAIPGTGPFRISLNSPLLPIGEPTEIRGDSQPGYNGVPLIEIDGANAGIASGLEIIGGGSTVRGLGIIRFSRYGIVIEGPGENHLLGNHIGCTGGGRVAAPNAWAGITIRESSLNAIGGAGLNDRNIISGNAGNGVEFRGANAFANYLGGNFIGVDSTGTNKLANATNGVFLSQAPGNVIGGNTPSERNVISGNGFTGITIVGEGSFFNQISGNYVGLNALGSGAISNNSEGILIFGAGYNTIGSSEVEGARNVVSGNGNFGVTISGPLSVSNVVSGNFIGTDASGTFSLGNRRGGLVISHASFSLVGGTTPISKNVISGNHEDGLVLLGSGAKSNLVAGNLIGLNASGLAAISNQWCGIRIFDSSYNRIGGTSASERNIISGNGDDGICIDAGPFSFNQLVGNYIGTDVNGTQAIGNGVQGIRIRAGANTIRANVISGNRDSGIFLFSTTNNVVQGNLIGLGVFGTNAVSNGRHGISIEQSRSNLIGGAVMGDRNVISGNNDHGIILYGLTTISNRVIGNYIGTDLAGNTGLANLFGGIYSYSAGTNLIGGAGAGEGNLISGNRESAISIGGAGANRNVVYGNVIGLRANKVNTLSNNGYGVEFVESGNQNIVGGIAPGQGNLIFYRANRAGIAVGNTTVRNSIRGNSIWAGSGVPIDIGKDGHTINDGGDGDGDGNGKQNFPALLSAVGAFRTVITGSISSLPNRQYAVDLFYSSASNSPGGQAQHYLGSRNVMAGASGFGAFNLILTNSAPIGGYVSATATDPDGNTSEVSFAVPIVSFDSDNDGMADDYEFIHGFNSLVNDSNGDKDGDKLTNLAELQLGTNPSDASSRVGLVSLAKNGSQIILEALTLPGRTYRIQLSDNPGGPWTNGTRVVATMNLSRITNNASSANTKRFYRMYQE